MKWTNSKVNKLTREEMIALIEKATNTSIEYTSASNSELKREVISYINKGLI